MPDLPDRENLSVPPVIPPNRPLRADRNLSYLEFIKLVNLLWNEVIGVREDGVTPKVPIHATGTALSDPDYPCIVYSLQRREPFTNEAKPKFKEVINDTDDKAIIISSQRFENYIRFTVYDRQTPFGPVRAEEIIEAFEDFMIECTAIFKRLGLSDFFYLRRVADDTASRENFDVVSRAVEYYVVIEKIIHKDAWRMRNVLINAATYINDNNFGVAATPSYENIDLNIQDQFSSPNF